MAPAIKKEDDKPVPVDQDDQMEVDETSEVEEQEEEEEENSDEEMDEEPDLVVSADKIEIVSKCHSTQQPFDIHIRRF